MSDEPKKRLDVPMLVLALLLLPIGLYVGVYFFARASHRLVHYSGGFIARPNATQGIGWSDWELAFAPLTITEELVRGAIDPSW